jgi:hypothetical protein
MCNVSIFTLPISETQRVTSLALQDTFLLLQKSITGEKFFAKVVLKQNSLK